MADNFDETFRRLKKSEKFFYLAFVLSAMSALILANYRQHLLFYFAFTVSIVYLVLMYKFSAFHNVLREPYWVHSLVLFLNISIFVMSFEHYVAGCIMMTLSAVLVSVLAVYKAIFAENEFFHSIVHRGDNGVPARS